MYAITGVTGKVGGATARALLAAGQSVRAVVRNVDKGQVWRNLGCKVALATIEDRVSLNVAFQRAEAVFVLVPPNFDPSPEFSEAREIGRALHSALVAARPKRVIYLSTIGAQAREINLVTQHSIIEKRSATCPYLSRSCVRLGLWRIAVGMWLRRAKRVSFPVFYNRSINQYRWW